MRYFIVIAAVLFAVQAYAEASSAGSYYVTADNLNVRLSPSPSGKKTNSLGRGSRVDVIEVQSGWARISRYYDGSVEGLNGQVARWVSAKFLSFDKPAGPQSSAGSTPLEKALSSSNDYGRYRSTFISASESLIQKGECTLGDFKENGGWSRSSSHKPKPVYFMYCGGFKRHNRLYLNAATGEVFR